MIELTDHLNRDQRGTLEFKDGLLIIRLYNEHRGEFNKLHVKPTPEMASLVAAIEKKAKIIAKEAEADHAAAVAQGEKNKAAVEARKASGGKPPAAPAQ